MSTAIIPAVDIIDGKCVRLTNGDYSSQTTYDSSPVDMVKRFVDAGLCRVHAVDLTGARLGHPSALRSLEQMASVSGARIEWGGGLTSSDALRDLFNAGATWGVIGSVAARKPELFEQWLETYGGDTIVLGADLRDGKVSVSGWLEDSPLTAEDLLDRFRPHGLSQAIVTDIAKDGMLSGPAFDLYSHLMAEYPDMQFCASGGVSGMADIERLTQMNIARIIVGKALYEGRVSLREIEGRGQC